jgi:hypothetical protein
MRVKNLLKVFVSAGDSPKVVGLGRKRENDPNIVRKFHPQKTILTPNGVK